MAANFALTYCLCHKLLGGGREGVRSVCNILLSQGAKARDKGR